MESWIREQLVTQIEQFDKAMEIYYPESKEYTQNAETFLKRVTADCNYLNAIKSISFEDYMNDNSTILDLAGGIGWLTAYLSTNKKVKKIYFLDSSKCYINEMLPKVMDLMGAEKDKVHPIEGLFNPLKFEDNFLDCVMVSSSLHHANNLENVLREINRVLKKDGYLFILNETPSSYFNYIKVVCKKTVKILKDVILKRYKSISPSISAAGTMYDPYLGDKDYPTWYWLDSIRLSGFTLEKVIDSKLATVKGQKGRHLVHFVCKK